MSPEADVRRAFPNLPAVHRTSNESRRYNCHAWAMERTDVWWDPTDPTSTLISPATRRYLYFPPGLPRDDFSLENFRDSYRRYGYEECADGRLELGFKKVAIYVRAGRVTHTARQLRSGAWTSKCGRDIDILHPSPEALNSPSYGSVAAYMKKPIGHQEGRFRRALEHVLRIGHGYARRVRRRVALWHRASVSPLATSCLKRTVAIPMPYADTTWRRGYWEPWTTPPSRRDK